MLSDRQMANKLQMSYDTLLRWRKDKPFLYKHIKEGFELKELLLNMDSNLKAISRKTALLKIKEKTTELNGNRLYEVKNVHPLHNSKEFISNKSYIWLETKDSEKLNVITYREDVFVKDLEDEESPLYVEIDNYHTFANEDGSEWLVSNTMTLDDVNDFFQWYKEATF